jgi:hypothetical protein
LYARFKLTVLSLPKLAPGYFAHFGDGSTLRGRVYASISNSAAGSFRLLVANGTGAPVEMPTDLATNTSYTVVTRYNLDTATSTLWLNPAAETDPGVTGTDSQTAAAIANYGFRQDTDLGGAYLVDDLAVGLTFASVVASGSPSRIPLLVSRSGANIVLQWSNPAFVLQSAPQAGGQYTNVPGASSPFTTAPNGPARFFRLKPN